MISSPLRRRAAARLLALALLADLLTCGPAHAYIDPGTGSYVLQVVTAAIFGSLFALKMFWRRITGFFTRSKPKNDLREH